MKAAMISIVGMSLVQAKAMQIQSAALAQNKGLIAYEWVKKWDGKQPQIVLGGGSIPMLNMGDLIKAKE